MAARGKSAVIGVLSLGLLMLALSTPASAQGIFERIFGGLRHAIEVPTREPTSISAFADPFTSLGNAINVPQRRADSGPGHAFCVRSCDGRYFPLTMRGGASPAQMCQAFCPASPTKVFFGSNIDGATSAGGERYADSDNAYAYRKAMRADCTCNGRDPAGLAPVDLTLDTSLRPGDVIATTSGLVAYSGVKTGINQAPEFTPVASYPGLTADVRARLGEMKVAPVAAEMLANDAPMPDAAVTVVPKSTSTRGKRAEAD